MEHGSYLTLFCMFHHRPKEVPYIRKVQCFIILILQHQLVLNCKLCAANKRVNVSLGGLWCNES